MRLARLAGGVALCACALTPAHAHHGVAALGAVGLEGPGAPLETSSSATLPMGAALTYLKLDYASYERSSPHAPDDTDHTQYWMAGLGYGATPWLSLYLFAPYNVKHVADEGSAGGPVTTDGFADVSLNAVLGFKYDEGLRLVPERESLDDLEDWHFTLYSSVTLPTGDANLKDGNGDIDAGQATGFGKPSFTLGLTATKQVSERLTLLGETSYLLFQEYEYDDGVGRRFGDEFRANAALSNRLYTDADTKLRLDGNLEANYLHIGRDETEGRGEKASGGQILYLTPSLRLYYESMSVGLGVKLPVWTDLNEEGRQQGSEGKEDYRLIVTFSALFQ
jgi:hypothetical protein